LSDVKSLFNNAKDLHAVIQKYIDEHDAMKKEVEKFQAQMVERTKNDLVSKAQEINGVKVVKAVLPLEPNAAKDLVFKIREAIPENLVAVIGSTSNDKPMLSVMFSDDMVKNHDLNAGKMIREAAKLIKGGGGGQPHYAQAGGKDVEGIHAAVDKIIELANL
jgi:alanyl-tRNA synthetase